MLTKFSSLLAIPVFPPFWVCGCFRAKTMPFATGCALWAQSFFRAWLSAAGTTDGFWADIGKLPLPNWETGLASAWWQDPGFRTSAYYFNLGSPLVSPLFSAFHSFADGIYSTLWGDGLISGADRLAFRPPWNYDLMNAGYLLAFGISVLFLVGFAVALVRFVRQPAPEWLLVFGLISLFGLGIVYISLRGPWLAHVKAFYAFPALVPFSALVAAGWNWLGQKHRALRTVLWSFCWFGPWPRTRHSGFDPAIRKPVGFVASTKPRNTMMPKPSRVCRKRCASNPTTQTLIFFWLRSSAIRTGRLKRFSITRGAADPARFSRSARQTCVDAGHQPRS